jgi:tellurite resistance protein TerC
MVFGQHSIWVWCNFNLFVIVMLVIDLGIFHRRQHAVSIRESLTWTGVWIAVAMAFNLLLLFKGQDWHLLAMDRDGNPLSQSRTAVLFLTAYLIEKSLSMDNIFVFLLIFKFFGIPGQYQHKVLFWGILGALVMRLAFILGGVALLHHFHWVAYVFGAILLLTGIKMWRSGDAEVHPDRNPVLRVFKRMMPVQNDLAGGRFAVKRDGRWFATPILVSLVVIETTDVLFAVDSVPAVLSVTTDPLIAYTSNVFAILGLRALYFALAGIMPLFEDLHYGLSFILIFVGGKMIAGQLITFPELMHWVSLIVIAATLVIAILTSVLRRQQQVMS